MSGQPRHVGQRQHPIVTNDVQGVAATADGDRARVRWPLSEIELAIPDASGERRPLRRGELEDRVRVLRVTHANHAVIGDG